MEAGVATASERPRPRRLEMGGGAQRARLQGLVGHGGDCFHLVGDGAAMDDKQGSNDRSSDVLGLSQVQDKLWINYIQNCSPNPL